MCIYIYIYISLVKQQFVVTHTIHQTDNPILLDSWVTNTPVEIWCPKELLLIGKGKVLPRRGHEGPEGE